MTRGERQSKSFEVNDGMGYLLRKSGGQWAHAQLSTLHGDCCCMITTAEQKVSEGKFRAAHLRAAHGNTPVLYVNH